VKKKKRKRRETYQFLVGKCAFCTTTAEDPVKCPVCGAIHCFECWHEMHGCSIYGCEARDGGTMLAYLSRELGVDQFIIEVE